VAGELDKSFLRLLPDFAQAKSEIMIDSEYIYTAPICLHPKEKYVQITNLDAISGFNLYSATTIAEEFRTRVIADGGTFEAFNCLVSFLNYGFTAELIDCSGNVLKDITSNVFYTAFTDINDIQQLAFEILPIQEDFYFKTCFLRLSFPDFETTLYSNGFHVTAEDENKTFRLDYKNIGYYQGISYDQVEVYQSIRLFGYFNQPTTKDEVTIYTQLNGQVRRSRPIQAIEYKYNIDLIDTFTFERLANCLNSQIVYLNGKRFTDVDNVQADERHGKSNLFSTSFKGQFNYKDTYSEENQIAPVFNYVSLYPLGNYAIAEKPDYYYSELNYEIESIDYVKIWSFDTDSLIQNLPYSISVGGFFEESLPDLPLGKYYITFKVTSIWNEVLEVTDKNIWNFTIQNADYSSTHYTNDYLT
jgi:hypothetical protein